MKREHLQHAIRAAAQVVDLDTLVIIGSQSILGTWAETELPEEATRSTEVDILPRAVWLSREDTQRLADKLSGLGEMSRFDRTHGFHIDGVDEETAVLPAGWENRLVSMKTYSVTLGRDVEGLCLDPHDLCIAKLVAFREKDRTFVAALIDHELIKPSLLLERATMTAHPDGRDLDYLYRWIFDRAEPSE